MKRKALVVDNHPMQLEFMTRLLEKNGFDVLTAEDGLSALDRLKTCIPEYLFIDLIMPNIDGRQLCRIIRSRPELNNSHIIILSAAAAEHEEDCTLLGADACIAKGPFDKMPELILDVIERLDKGEDISAKTLGKENVYPRQITRELISAKNHFEAILSNLREGIVELTPKGRIVYINPSALSIFDSSEEKLLSSLFYDLFSGEERKRIQKLLRPEILDGPLLPDSPLLHNGKQLFLFILPIFDRDQQSIFVILNDITEQKLAEARLLEAQKQDAITTLVGGIAHEFNNALFGISGNIELIQMDCSDEIDILEYLQPIKDSMKRMTSLTDQLLTYARKKKPEFQNVCLSRFFEDCLALIRYTIPSSIRVETEFTEPSISVTIDPTQMQLALSSVISNAVESLEDGGEIRILIKTVDIGKEWTLNHIQLKPGLYALLEVEDNGKGMDEKTKKRVFEPFFTTKFHGRGLGLASVYGIITQHKGWISLDSEPGRGTKVNIYLPAHTPEHVYENH